MPKILQVDPRVSGPSNYLAAGVAGGLARLAVNPFSNVKIYMQAGAPGSLLGSTRMAYFMGKMYGPSHVCTTGAGVAAARIVPHYALKFAVFDRLSYQFGIREPKGPQWPHYTDLAKCFVAGAAANGLATLVTHPLDVLKVRLVVSPPGDKAFYSSTAAAWAHMQSEGMFRGFYRGLGLSLIGATTFGGASMLCWWIHERVPWRRLHRPGYLFAELVEGPLLTVGLATVAVSAAYPFDVIRRRFMAQSLTLPNDGNLMTRFTNVGQLIVGIYRHNGIWTFWAGNLANMVKVTPQVLIFWALLRGQQKTLALGSS